MDVEKMRQSREEWMRIAFRQHAAAVRGKVASESLSLSESIACGFAFDLGREISVLREDGLWNESSHSACERIEKAVAP